MKIFLPSNFFFKTKGLTFQINKERISLQLAGQTQL